MENYAPPLVLVIGLLTFVGLWGAGTILLICLRLRLPSPWSHVTAILLGIQSLSLAVQILGIAEIASRPVLSTIWWILMVLGAVTLAFRAHVRFAISFLREDRWALLPLAIVSIAIATDLLIAIAPSTKIDELYYHMLVPSRIVVDGALRFYLEPWPGAILPHMVFQISSAPIHAMGYPDSANVVSWAMSATLIWFSWCVIRANTKSISWTALWIGALCVGLYPAIWQVTGGAHAMGDLAIAAAVVAFCSRDSLLHEVAPPSYAGMISILSLAAASSKITLLPLSAVILCVTAWKLHQRTRQIIWRITLAMIAPWIIFYCPILIWTWAQSGSPFGPILAGVMGPSVYPVGWFQKEFQATREMNQGQFLSLLAFNAINYSPLVWLGVVGALIGTNLSHSTRIALSGFFAMQCAIIIWLLANEFRYLGGLQLGLLIVFACYAKPNIPDRVAFARPIIAVSTIFLLPWLGLQVFYAKQFFPVSLGGDKSVFYKRYVAFYSDYLKLDKILSKDTVVLVSDDFSPGSVYMPRSVFFNSADLPRGKPVVWFASPETIEAAGASLAGHKIGSVIYENPRAVTETYRTPGREPTFGALRVVRLVD
jgi:hypothetical protein